MQVIVDDRAGSRQREALRKIILDGAMELMDSYGHQFAELHLSDSGVIRQASDRSAKPERSFEAVVRSRSTIGSLDIR